MTRKVKCHKRQRAHYANSPNGQSARKGRVPRRAECLEGQSALKCIVSQRENSTESPKVLKGLNSDKRDRGSRTTREEEEQ